MALSPTDSRWWSGKRIVVTGGAGFLGSHVVDRLVTHRGMPGDRIRIPRSKDFDLRDLDQAVAALDGADVVLHLAADIGGVGYSATHQAQQYYNCTAIDLNVVEAARRVGVERLVGASSTTAYADGAPSPLRESSLFLGLPHRQYLGSGTAKRNLIVLAEVYHGQYGLDMSVVIGANTYGTRDHFDPSRSHVVPATIRKCVAGDEELVVWGDGSQVRDFLYAEDFAEGVLLAAERLPARQYVNLGSGAGTSVRTLVRLIVEATGYRGEVVFDTTKPVGDPRRTTSIDMARRLIGFDPKTELREGLARTVKWYRETIGS